MRNSGPLGVVVGIWAAIGGCGDSAGAGESTTQTAGGTTDTPTTATPTTDTPTTDGVMSTTGEASTGGGTGAATGSSSGTTSDAGESSSTGDTGEATGTSTGEVVDTTTAAGSCADAPAWSLHAGGFPNSLTGRRMAVDAAGAVVISDRTRGTIDLGGETFEGEGYLLAKYDACGHIWHTLLGAPDGVAIIEDEAIAVDDAGNVFVAGSFSGAVTIGGQTLEAVYGTELVVDVLYTTTDAFLAKFSPAGELLWVEQFGDSTYQRVHDVVATNTGGAVVVGGVRGSFDLAGEPVVANDSYDGLVAEFGAAGDYLWHRTYPAKADVKVAKVVRSGAGLLTIAGLAGNGVDFGGGPLAVEDKNSVSLPANA